MIQLNKASCRTSLYGIPYAYAYAYASLSLFLIAATTSFIHVQAQSHYTIHVGLSITSTLITPIFIPSSLSITSHDIITYIIEPSRSVMYQPGNGIPSWVDSSGRLDTSYFPISNTTCDGTHIISSGVTSTHSNYTITYPIPGTYIMYDLITTTSCNVTVLPVNTTSSQLIPSTQQQQQVITSINDITTRMISWYNTTSSSLSLITTSNDTTHTYHMNSGISQCINNEIWYITTFPMNMTIYEGDHIIIATSCIPSLLTIGLSTRINLTHDLSSYITSSFTIDPFTSTSGVHHDEIITSGVITSGMTWTVTFFTSGIFPLIEHIHGMNGMIHVLPRIFQSHISPFTSHEYRTHSGYGNNIQHPTWGMSMDRYKRLTKKPFIWTSSSKNSTLPSGRLISNLIYARSHRMSTRPTSDLHTHYSFLVAMDVTKAKIWKSVNVDIPVPSGDVVFDPSSTGTQTLPFKRWAIPNMHPNEKMFVNLHTAWLDLDTIYGTWDQSPRPPLAPITSQTIREFVGGRLCETCGYGARPLVPNQGMWRPGDASLNLTPGTFSMAMIYVREHNRLCREMSLMHPTWDDETLYQESRRMVIAIHQKITTREYLAQLIGKALPPYTGYNATLHAMLSMEFANAAYRYGHIEIHNMIWRRDEQGDQVDIGDIALPSCLNRAMSIVNEVGGLDPILRGMISQRQGTIAGGMSDALRNIILNGAHPSILPVNDLAATDIHRGRDLGLPTYNEMRRILGLPMAITWENITSNIEIANILSTLYEHVDDVDLWVGGTVEDIPDGAGIGITFGTMIRKQFQILRDADRFWYENTDQFNPNEISTIYATTMATLIQRNTNITTTPKNVFFQPTLDLELYGTGTLTSFIPASYEHKYILQTSTYHLAWNIIDNAISIELQVKNRGWVGIGLEPEMNTMKGADIIMCQMWNDGSFVIQDSIALDVGIPTADTAVGGIDNLYDKSAQRMGEIQIFRFKRLLNTGDVHDKMIRSGPMHIIFAFHPTIVEYTYHGPLRSPATYIDFFTTEKQTDISYNVDTYAVRISIIVITSLLCALPIILCILIIHNRDQPVIRASTVLFCVLITLGALIGYIAVILSAMQRTTFTCNAFFWLTGIAWVLVYGSILTKTWRIHRIFNVGGRKLTPIHISTSKLTFYLSGFLFAEVLLLTIWSTVDPLHVVWSSSSSDHVMVETCSSNNDAYLIIWIVYKLLLLLGGAYLSFSVRNLTQEFNESAPLTQSIYISTILAMISIIFGFSLRTYTNTVILIEAVSVLGSLSYPLAALFISKLINIHHEKMSELSAVSQLGINIPRGPNKHVTQLVGWTSKAKVHAAPQQHERTGKMMPLEEESSTMEKNEET